MYLQIKNAILKIKHTIGRFFSLFFIVALGLGFFSGVRQTSEDMLITADNYYDENVLYDYKIVSTFGLTNEDIDSLKNVKNVSKVYGTYSTDILVGSKVYRVHAIMNKMNKVILKKGRQPLNNNECLAENGVHKIGDKIKFKQNDKLKQKEFVVVGLVESPIYIGIEKGITQIGNGKLNSYIYVLEDSFDIPYYTEAYLTVKKARDVNSYYDSYNDIINPVFKELKKLKPVRETLRYEEVYEKVMEKIFEQEEKIDEEIRKVNNKLNNGQDKINEAYQELDDGNKALSDAKINLKEKNVEGHNKIDEERNNLKKKEDALNEEIENYNLNKNNIKKELELAYKKLKLLEDEISKLDMEIAYLEKTNPQSSDLIYLKKKKQELQQKYDKYSEEVHKKEENFNNAPETFKKAKEEIVNGYLKLNEVEENLNKELAFAQKKIKNTEKQLADNEKELKTKEEELLHSKNDFNKKINDVNKKINDSKKEVDKLPKPVWYLLNRTDQTAYTDFKNDALRVDNIAKVFPIFFLLVAALVCLNTMSRMVEEDRTEIGLYKALGYKNGTIILNYFIYVIIATLGGGILGIILGNNIFPKAIFSIYKVTYTLPNIIIKIDVANSIIILSISLIVTLLVTYFTSYKELLEEPANLLRPKPPKSGKKVFLEKIGIIWEKISFSGKVTIRNLFRYKKRIFMTIIGIAGCTALTLTGFGLRDGITPIIKKQYTDLFTYDLLAVLNQNEKIESVCDTLKKNNIVEPIFIKLELSNFKANDKNHDFFLIVPNENDFLKKYINFVDYKTHKKVNLPQNGALITEKMAELLKVKVGDNIKIRNSDNKLFLIKVSGILENYTYHYVYMTREYYEHIFDEEVKPNIVYASLNNNITKKDEISKNLLNSKKVLTITYTEDTIKTFDTMISSLNKIVSVILISSCMLAIIVLYNLTNINIIERKREIATLKVLGFYDNEVSNYIYRETMLLTILGIIVGLFGGIFLHRFVMHTAEMDFVMFIKNIKPISYFYASLLTLLFSLTVAIFTHFKLKKIDMIESLKSIE